MSAFHKTFSTQWKSKKSILTFSYRIERISPRFDDVTERNLRHKTRAFSIQLSLNPKWLWVEIFLDIFFRVNSLTFYNVSPGIRLHKIQFTNGTLSLRFLLCLVVDVFFLMLPKPLSITATKSTAWARNKMKKNPKTRRRAQKMRD